MNRNSMAILRLKKTRHGPHAANDAVKRPDWLSIPAGKASLPRLHPPIPAPFLHKSISGLAPE